MSAKPAQIEERDVPAPLGDPVYSARKVGRVSLGGVAVGTLVAGLDPRQARASDAPIGGTMILNLPSGGMGAPANAAQELEESGPRKFPIDAEKVIGPFVGVTDFRVTLPEGWTARLPQNVNATSAFGSYRAEFAQTGRELRVVRTVSGARGVYPPDRVADLIAWLRAAAKDDAKFLLIDRGT